MQAIRWWPVPDAAAGAMIPRATRARAWRRVDALHWVARGGWAVADQASFALSNFVVTVLLARWLPPLEFGAFITSYSVFLLV